MAIPSSVHLQRSANRLTWSKLALTRRMEIMSRFIPATSAITVDTVEVGFDLEGASLDSILGVFMSAWGMLVPQV